MPNQEGFGKGQVFADYPGVDDGVPLLNSFYFRFEQEEKASRPVDNRIHSIRVLPAGVFVDMSPNADLSPSFVEPGKVHLMFRDDDADDEKDRFFYKVAHSNLPLANARRFQFRDVGCIGKCEQVLPKPPGSGITSFEDVFVLVGFQLFFTGGRDRDIDTIGVFEDNGKLTVEFNDRKDDDVFQYLVDYALVRRVPGQNIQLGEESGIATGGARVTIPSGPKVIRGFRFDFTSNDRHLREIGVIMEKDTLQVFYADRTPNDEFRWFVRWASISEQVIDPTPF